MFTLSQAQVELLEALRVHADRHDAVANLHGPAEQIELTLDQRGQRVFSAGYDSASGEEPAVFAAAHRLLDCGAFGSCQ